VAAAGIYLNLFPEQPGKALLAVYPALACRTVLAVAVQAQQAETSTAALAVLVALASNPPSTAQPLSVLVAALRRTSAQTAVMPVGQVVVALAETLLEQLLVPPHQTALRAPAAAAVHLATAALVLS
jgi:hypothetical protein